jgi:hypothetical protein
MTWTSFLGAASYSGANGTSSTLYDNYARPYVSAGLEESRFSRDFRASGSIFREQTQSRARERHPVAVARARTGGKKAAEEVT